ncbi:MAG: hypothetical protein M3N46_07665, partial [Actinomycetota bacterium]|nr:hypothetical protein [Actinomycetota bacterium]
MFSPRTALTTATALVAAGLLLAGCSAGASAQTTTQACKALSTDLTSSATQLSAAFSSLQSDPKGAETALAKFGATLKAANAKVTNAKVKDAATATSKAVDSMDSDLKSYIKDSSATAALESSASKVQSTFT